MTQQTFQQKYLEAVARKGSILCAGLDPAEFEMGRGEKGLPKKVAKLPWSEQYLKAVAPFCAAVKPNVQYWKGRGDSESVEFLIEMAHDLGMVVIDDSKLADIEETNDAGLFYSQRRQADAVTFAPFAGNLEEAVKQAHARGLGLIPLCIMSNPEYEREKNKLVKIEEPESPEYASGHILMMRQLHGSVCSPFVRQYIQLAHDSHKFVADAIVVGAPSKKNHITEEEVRNVSIYYHGLVLVPGIGAQGGEADILAKYFNPDHLIVNVGRALMLPQGSNSTPQQQAETARTYRDMLNKLRAA